VAEPIPHRPPMSQDKLDTQPSYKLLSVIVPVYNERNTVTEILRRMRLVELPIDLEVIVVDDGSTDGTDRVLAALEDSTVRVLTHRTNQGKGSAVRTGLQTARGDLVLIQDADLEYDPSDWTRLLQPVLNGRAKVVYGSRYIGEREAVSLRRWMADRGLSALASVLYNSAISDMQTCFKLVDRQVLNSISLASEHFDLEPEITAKLLRAGHRIYEVPVSFSGRRRSEGRKYTWRDGVEAAATLVRLRFTRR